MYQYYKSVEMEEHMLYSNEIAKAYGLYTISGNPHSMLVTALIKDYCEVNNRQVDKLYYKTAKGLARVYSVSLYSRVMDKFLGVIDLEMKIYTSIEGKTYKFKLQGGRERCL